MRNRFVIPISFMPSWHRGHILPAGPYYNMQGLFLSEITHVSPAQEPAQLLSAPWKLLGKERLLRSVQGCFLYVLQPE